MIDLDQKLSPHFTLREMTVTAHRRYIQENQKVGEVAMTALRALCTDLLEPVREKFGPVIIHSGYRCQQLNSAIGSHPTSQHPKGQAADFHCANVDLMTVFNWIKDESGFGERAGQLILEGWSRFGAGWIHLSLGEPFRHRGNAQAMTWTSSQGYHVIGSIR